MKLSQNGGTKTDTIVKLILVFFVSLLSFSVGTFVGKQFSDSQHRLAALENEYNKDAGEGRDVASVNPDAAQADDSAQPKEILSNDDVSKLAEEFVQENGDKKDVRKVAANNNEVPADGDIQLKPATTKEVAEKVKIKGETPAIKVAEGKAPLEAEKPVIDFKKEQKNLPADVAGDAKGKYTIQVSSHQTEAEAKARVEQLTNKGYVSSYISASVGGKTWYRVGIGTFSTVKSAKEYLAKVKEDPSFKGAIIRQIVQ